MEEGLTDSIAFEQLAKNKFGIRLDVDQVILRKAPVSPTATATVCLTNKRQLFCMINAKSNLTLGDVRKITARMGLGVELYVPPKGWPNYFDDVGERHFKSVFPGRSHVTADDLRYYRTLAPYNPALVQIKDIPKGEIYRYDSDSRDNWRTAVKFTYRRIRTI